MLEIKKEHPRTFIVPCYDNDLIWHTHQQHPLAYQQDTSSILGKMLDHNDTTSDRSPGSELENGSAATKRLWKQKGHKFSAYSNKVKKIQGIVLPPFLTSFLPPPSFFADT